MKRAKVLAVWMLSGALVFPSSAAIAAYWTYTDWSCGVYYTDVPDLAGLRALLKARVVKSYIAQAEIPPICRLPHEAG